VDVRRAAEVSEVHVASIFRVEVFVLWADYKYSDVMPGKIFGAHIQNINKTDKDLIKILYFIRSRNCDSLDCQCGGSHIMT
jgi:hypothetical protein